MKKLIGIIAATALAATIAAPAAAAPDKKGSTTVTVSPITKSVLAEAPILRPGSLAGTREVDSEVVPSVKFGIVGNVKRISFDPLKGVIKHVGGVALDTTAFPDGVNDSSLRLRNFWIDLNAGEVTGLVEGIGRAPLFEFAASTDCETNEVQLAFTTAASDVVTGDPNAIAGAWAGCAAVDLNTDFPARGR